MRLKYQRPRKRRRAFTLVELAIALVITGVLSSAVFVGGAVSVQNARVTSCVDDMQEMQAGLCMYMEQRFSLVQKASAVSLADAKAELAKINELLPTGMEFSDDDTLMPPATGDIRNSDADHHAFRSEKSMDPWSNPYYLIMDTTNRNGTDGEYYITVLSAGPNGKLDMGGTFDDDDIFLLCQYSNGESSQRVYKMAKDTEDGSGNPLEAGVTTISSLTGGDPTLAPKNFDATGLNSPVSPDPDPGAGGHIHNYDWEVTVPATCTRVGSRTGTCTVTGCPEPTKTEAIPMIPHNFVRVALIEEATCQELGKETVKCSVCGFTKDRDIPLKDHHYVLAETIQAVSCTDEGIYKKKCDNTIRDGSVCGHTIEEHVDPWGHDNLGLPEHVDPTCTTDGHDLSGCRRESCPLNNYRKINRLQHDYPDTWTLVTAATCTTTGSQSKTCRRAGCGHVDTMTLPAMGHILNWETEAVVDTPATCTEDGSEHTICKREGCGAQISRTITRLGHDYGDWIVTKVATCTETGSKHRVCSRCSYDDIQTIPIDPNNHNYEDKSIAPTCTVDGKTWKECSRCHNKTNETPVNKLGHSFGNWVTTKGSNCTEPGTEKRTCNRSGCGVSETRTVAALGHDYPNMWATVTEPACTTEGTKTRTCIRSGCGTADTKPIPALGHQMVRHPELDFASKCTIPGHADSYKCERAGCDHITYTTLALDPNNHQMVKNEARSYESTCVVNGRKVLECELCHNHEEIITLDLKPHSYKKDEGRSTESTCLTHGYEVKICSMCSDVKTTMLPLKSHAKVNAYLREIANTYKNNNGSGENDGHTHGWQTAFNPDEEDIDQCFVEGWTFKYCTICGAMTDEEHVVREQHKYVLESQDGCTAHWVCERETCPGDDPSNPGNGPSRTNKTKHIGPYEDKELEAHCETVGYKAVICKNCGTEVSRSSIPPQGHLWSFKEEIKSPQSPTKPYLCKVWVCSRPVDEENTCGEIEDRDLDFICWNHWEKENKIVSLGFKDVVKQYYCNDCACEHCKGILPTPKLPESCTHCYCQEIIGTQWNGEPNKCHQKLGEQDKPKTCPEWRCNTLDENGNACGKELGEHGDQNTCPELYCQVKDSYGNACGEPLAAHGDKDSCSKLWCSECNKRLLTHGDAESCEEWYCKEYGCDQKLSGHGDTYTCPNWTCPECGNQLETHGDTQSCEQWKCPDCQTSLQGHGDTYSCPNWTCPDCGEQLETHGDTYSCPNWTCPEPDCFEKLTAHGDQSTCPIHGVMEVCMKCKEMGTGDPTSKTYNRLSHYCDQCYTQFYQCLSCEEYWLDACASNGWDRTSFDYCYACKKEFYFCTICSAWGRDFKTGKCTDSACPKLRICPDVYKHSDYQYTFNSQSGSGESSGKCMYPGCECTRAKCEICEVYLWNDSMRCCDNCGAFLCNESGCHAGDAHMGIHNGPHMFICPHCSDVFYDSSEYSSHEPICPYNPSFGGGTGGDPGGSGGDCCPQCSYNSLEHYCPEHGPW